MRNTVQTTTVLESLERMGHATNLELWKAVQSKFPDISATTVHRITKRLVEEHRIGQLRSPLDGTMLFDANPVPHYHFGCRPCGKIEDIELSSGIIGELQDTIGKKIFMNDLAVIGISATCPKLHANFI